MPPPSDLSIHPTFLIFFFFLLGGILGFPAQLPFASAKRQTDLCHLPPDAGPCLALFRRWYFNPWVGRCLTFIYGGCQGNENNFETLQGCERRCLTPQVCHLPAEPGPCDAAIIRFFYDSVAKTCARFIYGGCGGNKNNFRTLEECQRACGAQVKPGTCPILLQRDRRLCGQFCSSDNSCPGAERCCKSSCGQRCLLPLEEQFPKGSPKVSGLSFILTVSFLSAVKRGYCPRPEVRPGSGQRCLSSCDSDGDCGWGLRIPRRKCCRVGCQQICLEAEEEHPGVCPKREVVLTFVPCNDTCADDRDCPLHQKCCFTGCSLGCLNSVRSDQCQLPPEKGPCRARIRRFYYSPSQKKCLQFYYGGCEGNSNNFKTKKECEDACGKLSPNICKQPVENGKCLAYSEFFYYNASSRSCETTTYCGCKDNANRFDTKLECLMVCGNSTKTSED
uniref:Actinia tenebrosa protease inhibitors-like n=1 Tax=Pogona vitticeps TaxID=103695 RepID=A0ABM5G4L6_9SAUR